MNIENNITLDIFRNLADREISLANDEDDLLRIKKFWKEYFAQVNKWLAGKRDEPPYLSDDGRNII